MAPTDIVFFLNGERKVVSKPDPRLMLIDYMRQPEIGLSGPKKPCGQGGCGGCTVVISHFDTKQGKPVHAAINACLRPVAGLNGLSVTTVEGTGRVKDSMNPVAHRLAVNNGTQCGYCTNGWVMAMTGFLANDPAPSARTKKDIEGVFDGNLCRCTGYRSILEGMKTFASDWTAADEKNRMPCVIDKTFDAGNVSTKVEIPFGKQLNITPTKADYVVDGRTWVAVTRVQDAIAAYQSAQKSGESVRFVHANTGFGVYKSDFDNTEVFIDIGSIDELSSWYRPSAGQINFGAGLTYSSLLEHLVDAGLNDGSVAGALKYMANRTAGTLVRNAATVGGNTMLVAEHILSGEPFPSDLVTALCGLDARITYYDIETGERESRPPGIRFFG